MDTCAPQTAAFAIGDLLGQIMNPADARWKVHAGTATRRGEEGLFYTRIHKRLRARILAAAERGECRGMQSHRTTKNKRRNGPLGAVGLNVLRFLLRTLNANTGQLDPSIGTIARETGHSAGGVHAALGRLAKAGYVQWIRRYVEKDGRRGRKGPQLEQTSNAYRITVPAEVAATWTDAPLPADEEWRRKADRAAFADMNRDPQLALALERLGRLVQRDSMPANGINPRFN